MEMTQVSADRVRKTYLSLVLFSTLSSSLIWGINTLFLLSAGLNNLEAFAANAFFTAGQVLFEIPTGIVADMWGRRVSYLLGVVTLSVTTVMYWYLWQIHAPFYAWAIVSMLLGLGFTFFSGATEAWLVDALHATDYKGKLESVFAQAQITAGVAMLGGSVAGGYIAQISNLGVPFIIRAGLLVITFIIAAVFMHDIGFKPDKSLKPVAHINHIFKESIDYGLRQRSVRWLMISAPFTSGVGIYAFYALQPYLLELYGDPKAYGVAGLAAAIVAGAQIIGGLVVPKVVPLFGKRTTILLIASGVSVVALASLGVAHNFYVAIGIMVLWAIAFSLTTPVRQTYLNGMIPSQQRATVLSFDSLMGSAGGVVSQPLLGRAADLYGYGTSYLASAGIQLIALPFIYASRRTHNKSDKIIT